MELYYAIMNIVDYIALNPVSAGRLYHLKHMMTELASMEDISILDIADANDCGKCETWDELIKAIREQFNRGDRV